MFRLARGTLHTTGFLPSRRTGTAGGTASSLLQIIRRSSSKSNVVSTRIFAASSDANDRKAEETKLTLNDATKNGTRMLEKWKSTTVSRILSESIELLEQHNIPEPIESAVNLLAASLDLPWETGHRDLRQVLAFYPGEQQRPSAVETLPLSSSSKRCLTATELQDYASKIERRLQHEPIQYILGQWDFLDYTLRIERPLLCPRPETEELVGLVLQDMKKLATAIGQANPTGRRRVLDIGCGTGCIGVALAADADSDCHVTAIDVEPVAVKVAAENAALILGPSWRDQYSVVLESAADYRVMQGDGDGGDNRFHVVVSNPPYIPATDKASLSADVVNYESATALFGGHDGLDVIRTIVRRLPEWCVAGAICWMEVDPTHPALLRQWLESSGEGDTLGVEYVTDCQDLYGRDRFVKLRVIETR
jgi:release factor glutamine methyltransferase